MKIIFTCGGTAGHINPALALANTVRARRPDAEILFVGAQGQMEARLIPKAGFDVKLVHTSGFWRFLSWRAIRHNLGSARNLIRSRREAAKIISDFRPDLVVGTGGFASYPAVREAARRGIPTAIHESNAIPGLTTRKLAAYADKVMVGLFDPAVPFPHPERVEATGTPVRPDFYAHTRREARAALGIPDDKPLVLSYWGSLGAKSMNGMMEDFLALSVKAGCPFRHIHGAGADYYPAVLEALKARGVDLADHPELEVREYIHDMPLVMAAADVVLCRAGASTISELTALAKPAVLVPSPNVVNDHQTKNARLLSDAGGAVLLPESECTPEKLWTVTRELLDDPARRKEMGAALSRVSPPDANDRIYDILMALAAGK